LWCERLIFICDEAGGVLALFRSAFQRPARCLGAVPIDTLNRSLIPTFGFLADQLVAY
jgi:hypothetical protein